MWTAIFLIVVFIIIGGYFSDKPTPETKMKKTRQATKERKEKLAEKNSLINQRKIKEKELEEIKKKLDKDRKLYSTKVFGQYDEIFLDTNALMDLNSYTDQIFDFIINQKINIHLVYDVNLELQNLRYNKYSGTNMAAVKGLSRISDLRVNGLIINTGPQIQGNPNRRQMEQIIEGSYADPIFVNIFNNDDVKRLLITDDGVLISEVQDARQKSGYSNAGINLRLRDISSKLNDIDDIVVEGFRHQVATLENRISELESELLDIDDEWSDEWADENYDK